MKLRSAIALITLTVWGAQAEIPDIDSALATLAGTLATKVKEQGKKKVAVIDFADLQGATEGELGKYIAEQLTVNLVMEKREFAVLDRANLRKILAEHKLTSEGLIDPENAKKLGQFAGVDALILGTIIPKGTASMGLNAKIITTDTAEIVGAARAEFKVDPMVEQLLSAPAKGSGESDKGAADPAVVVKTFGDFQAVVESLKIVNGNQYLLTMTLTNLNKKKSIWVAVSTDMGDNPKAIITDPQASEFRSNPWGVSGVEHTAYAQYGYQGSGFYRATEIKPGDSVSASVKFASFTSKPASAGQCNVQLEFLVGHDFNGNFGHCTPQNLMTKIEAN